MAILRPLGFESSRLLKWVMPLRFNSHLMQRNRVAAGWTSNEPHSVPCVQPEGANCVERLL